MNKLLKLNLGAMIDLVFLEIRKKSLNTAIGWLWSLVNPLFQVGLIFFITTVVFKSDRPNLAVWLLTTMSTWVAVQSALLKASSTAVSRRSLIQNSNISIRKLVLIDVLVELTILLPFQLIGTVLVLFSGREAWRLSLLFPVLLVTICFSYFLGLFLACITPWFRDVPYIVGLGLQIVFWASPVVYSRYEVSGLLRTVMDWNPFTYILELTQFVFQGNAWTPASLVAPVAICIVVALLAETFTNNFYKKSVVFL